jgi:hypothetical protein
MARSGFRPETRLGETRATRDQDEMDYTEREGM